MNDCCCYYRSSTTSTSTTTATATATIIGNATAAATGATTASNGAVTSLIAARCKASSLSSSSSSFSSSPRRRRTPKKKKRGRKGGRRRPDDESDESDDDDDYGHSSSTSTSNNNMRGLQYDGTDDDFSYYQWIPCVLFESASYTDATDSDMHSRVVQLVDELLLGCSSPHPENRRQLTSTARATGFAVVVDAVRNQSPLAWHWMAKLQSVRAKLQKTLKAYLDVRADIRNHETGKLSYVQLVLFSTFCSVPSIHPSLAPRHDMTWHGMA